MSVSRCCLHVTDRKTEGKKYEHSEVLSNSHLGFEARLSNFYLVNQFFYSQGQFSERPWLGSGAGRRSALILRGTYHRFYSVKGRVERLLEGDLSPASHSSSPMSLAKYSLLDRSHPWEVEVLLMVISTCFSLISPRTSWIFVCPP